LSLVETSSAMVLVSHRLRHTQQAEQAVFLLYAVCATARQNSLYAEGVPLKPLEFTMHTCTAKSITWDLNARLAVTRVTNNAADASTASNTQRCLTVQGV
jgi:hypothetical protein